MSDFGALVLFIWGAASWLTHVVVCLKTASWGFLIAGALMFPIAMVHGTGIWLGVW
jgi:hypothetical protein